MAINITNSQGSKVYICATAATAVTDPAEIATAISAGSQIGCLQSLGGLSVSRSVQEYSCLSEDQTAKAFGSLSLGNFEVSTLFDGADTTGQAELRTIFASNATRTMIIELNDNAGVSPTYITFEGAVASYVFDIQKDSAVMYNSTIEVSSNPAFVYATAV